MNGTTKCLTASRLQVLLGQRRPEKKKVLREGGRASDALCTAVYSTGRGKVEADGVGKTRLEKQFWQRRAEWRG